MKKRKNSIFRYYIPAIKKHKNYLIAMILGMLAVIMADLFLPFFLKDLTNLFVELGDKDIAEATQLLWGILGLFMITWLGWRVNEYSITRFEIKSMQEIAQNCFEKIQKHSFRFFSDNFTGSFVKKISRFVFGFESLIDLLYFNFLYQTIYITSVFVIFLMQKTLLGIIFLIWSVLFLLGNYFFAMWKMKYDKEVAKADSEVGGLIADSFSNYSTVKFFAQEKLELEKFKKINQSWYQKKLFSWDLTNHINFFQSFLMLGLELLVYYFAVQWWKKGDFSVGEFVFIQAYLLGTFHRLWDFGRNIRDFFTRLADAQEMVDIFEQETEIQDKTNAKKIKVSQGEIEFKNVDFQYEKEDGHAFKDFSLQIKAGEKIAIVGHSGGGKSTLVKLIFRLYNIQSGEILIDGQNIANITQNSLRKNISLVPQDPNLFHRSIAENIAYGKSNATEKEITNAAKLAQADKFIQKLSKGYQTFVGERGVKLSGGEKQRIAIARVILENAKILVLDEATSSLDSVAEKEIQQAIENIMGEKTVIIIAHRLSTIKKVDRVIVLDEGKVLEEGTHNQLLRKKGKYAELWSHQVGGFLAE